MAAFNDSSKYLLLKMTPACHNEMMQENMHITFVFTSSQMCHLIKLNSGLLISLFFFVPFFFLNKPEVGAVLS